MTRYEQLYGVPIPPRRHREMLWLMISIEVVFAFSYLGFIVIPPISVTTVHILVLIAAMLLGTADGVVVSVIFALTSIWQATVSSAQYSDIIFSPLRSGMPVSSLLLNCSRLLLGVTAGILFGLCFRTKRKHIYVWLFLISIAATWVYGTSTYFLLAVLFPETGIAAADALTLWATPSNLLTYGVTALVVPLVYYLLGRKKVRETMAVLCSKDVPAAAKKNSGYAGIIAMAVVMCIAMIAQLMIRLWPLLEENGYAAPFRFAGKETQVFLQFLTAFCGILVILSIIVRWIGEYYAAQTVFRQRQEDAEEKLAAEQALNQRLQEQNAKLEQAMRESQRLADEARAANEAKSGFLSRMTHDIRTPLNGIIGLLEIDQRHADDLELIRRNREKMQVAAHHLLSLINDVLQMSKLEDGRYALAREAVDLPQLMADIQTILSPRAADMGVKLECDTGAAALPHPVVWTSPLHLRQILLNIYSNGIKFNHMGGSVTTQLVCLGMQGNVATYRWTIHDTGVGMSADFLPHLFEPFAQERQDARSVYQGTGLGMAIVKNLVEAMGGEISAASEVGVGTMFEITMPFEIAASAQLEAAPAGEGKSIAGLHLLLAEDNALNAEIAQQLLQDAGAEITLVQDGRQAVEAFMAQPPGTFDGILMDLMMPVMDGLTAALAIRGLERADAKTIPIIAMTANAFDDDVNRCLEAGMNAHLAKPIQMDAVTETIARCCGNK